MALEVDRSTVRGVEVVTLRGELDTATTGAAYQALDQAMYAGGRLLIDLSELSFMDSTGVRLLVAAAREARPLHVQVEVACPPESNVGRILAVMGVDRALNLSESFDEALRRLA